MPNEDASMLPINNLQVDDGVQLKVYVEAQNKSNSQPSLDYNRNESENSMEIDPVIRSDVIACMEEDVDKLQRVLQVISSTT